jgi:hypothetical protein
MIKKKIAIKNGRPKLDTILNEIKNEEQNK